MLLKKIFNTKTLIFILLVSVLFIYFYCSKQHLYGNDKKSIAQVIRSIEGYQSKDIEILDIKDIKDDRIAGFLINNSPAYIQFSKNPNGNYEWNHIEKHPGDSFTSFSIDVSNKGNPVLKFMIVTNEDNEIAKLQVKANNHVIEQSFNVKRKSVSWIDLPESKDKSYAFTYKYFDDKGNLIKDQ